MHITKLTPKKQKLLLILAHLSPMPVSPFHLNLLMGYSPKSREMYKGILSDLKEEGYIQVHENDKNRKQVVLSNNHPYNEILINLVNESGTSYREQIFELLNSMEN
jgi:predicted transcriptional regulator